MKLNIHPIIHYIHTKLLIPILYESKSRNETLTQFLFIIVVICRTVYNKKIR